MHTHIIGQTGTGKSTFLAHQMARDLQSGAGFCLLDPNGDLANTIADTVPPERTNDVIFIQPRDPGHAHGLNPLIQLTALERAALAARIVDVIRSLNPDSWGPRLDYILTNCIRLLLERPNTSLIDLPRLLTDRSFRRLLLARCGDPFIKAFFDLEYDQWTEKFRSEAISPIQNKVGQIANNPLLRHLLAHRTLSMADIMDRRKILIVNLSKSIGQEPSRILGGMIVAAIMQAAEARDVIPEHDRVPFKLYMDEFQNFITPTIAEALAEARKYKLSLILAHQYLHQIEAVEAAVMANTFCKIAFRISADDAERLASPFELAARQLIDLPDYSYRTVYPMNGMPSQAALRRVEPFVPAYAGRIPAIVARNRARWAVPREQLEKRFTPPRPKLRWRGKTSKTEPSPKTASKKYGSKKSAW
jgi:hypothetical protein